MTKPTTQPTLDWHYLPELPGDTQDCLIATCFIRQDEAVIIVYKGQYEGDEYWVGDSGLDLDNVYAWATWPKAPPVPVG